jgi:hypothetical protein
MAAPHASVGAIRANPVSVRRDPWSLDDAHPIPIPIPIPIPFPRRACRDSSRIRRHRRCDRDGHGGVTAATG